MSEAVALVAHDRRWAQSFATERDAILRCFATPPLLVEHMGSTAIPGLAAKPLIDIIVLVETLEQARPAIAALVATGYIYRDDFPDRTKLFLMKRATADGPRTHHLHIHDDAGEVDRHLLFRDRLRADPAARQAYGALKADLAARFGDDREAYSRHKTAFIDEIVLSMGGPARRMAWNP